MYYHENDAELYIINLIITTVLVRGLIKVMFELRIANSQIYYLSGFLET